MDEIKCPNCDENITGDQLGYFFQDRYDDGAVETVKCKSCGTLFTLTQHSKRFYTINECGFGGDMNDACANIECENNSMKMGYKNIEPSCVHAHKRPCFKYKPPEKMIVEYEKSTGEKYVQQTEE